MLIHEAVCATTPAKPCIYRKAWDYPTTAPVVAAKILPTNSLDGCVIYTAASKEPRRGWQPIAADLIADDWEVARL